MNKIYRKGQSILEYTLLLGAIIAVLVAVLLNGGARGSMQTAYNKVGNSLTDTISKLDSQVFGTVD
jgi:Flp pilus assembly pilin Flp